MKQKKSAALLLTLSFIFLSCQKSVSQKYVNWSEGDPIKNQKIISEIQTQAKPAEIFYKNEKIHFFEQFINNQKVQNTFVKKQYGQNSNIKNAEASFFDQKNLNTKNIPLTKMDPSQITKALVANSPTIKIKNITSENILQIKNGQLISILAVNYEISDGTIWLAQFDPSMTMISNQRQGSGFTDSLVSIYRLGPMQSRLTDALLKGLDPVSPLLNQNIFVDNESPKKISVVLPEMKFDPKDDRFDQLQVFYYLDFIQTWMQKNLNVRFPEKLNAIVNVGFPDKTNTAFYFQNQIRIGHGDDISYSLMASDPSIVFHESFHALIDGLARLPFDGEGGSMNEGFADFFTCVALNRPYLGESSYLKAEYTRSLLTVYNRADRTGGLYHDSLIISGLLWSINDKVGSEKSLKIAADVLSKLNPASGFDDFNTQLLKVLPTYLTATELQTVATILKARGFKYE